jgi:5-methylcytosine-specific restriction protein A
MLRGLRRRVEPHRADFDIAVMELMSEPMTAPPGGNRSPRRAAGPDSDFIRCPMVAAWILQRCRGVCGRCGKAAPFTRPNGQPYLEVHHVLPLSEGGPDTVDNAIALCPNCHRRAHHGSDRRDVRQSLGRSLKGRGY